MERRDSHLAKVKSQEQSKGQTPGLGEDSNSQNSPLSFGILGSEGPQMSLEKSPETEEEDQKPSPAAATAQQYQQEPQDKSHAGFQEAAQRVYWAELQNTLPLPMTNLLEEEALQILTKSLYSYHKFIGEDHKLTKQLQRQVTQLSKNLKSRQPT